MHDHKREKILTLFVAWGLVGIFCSTQEAHAEEMLPSTPMEIPLPGILSSPSTSESIPSLPFEERVLSREKDFVLDEIWPFHLPEGREIVLAHLQGRFVVGKKAVSLIYHPKATLSVQAKGGFRDYIGGVPPEEKWRPLTDAEKVKKGFKFAESITESIQALPIPFLGSFLGHCLRVGRKVDRFDKRIKNKYHLHLKYSDKTLRAAYKDAF